MNARKQRTIFHVDVNSAFLSWSAIKKLKEEKGSVDLRTIPSAVAGDVETRHGIVTAKSIPAKKYGVETGEPVGCMGYYAFGESNIDIGEEDAELGYWIARPYWNQGLCTEALRAMVAWCFNVKGFQVLWSDFFVDNPASGRVMEKCGFRDTGEINWCSHLYRGDERPVKVMRLDYALD